MKIDILGIEYRAKMFQKSLDRLQKDYIDDNPMVSETGKLERKFVLDCVRDSFHTWLGSVIESEVPHEA